MTFTLKKSLYDNLAGWKWRALKHVMGDLLLGTPAGLDPENPILDADGNRLVAFSDARFDGEKAAALRIILEAVDSYADDITDAPETVLAPIAGKGGMVPEWDTGIAYAVDDLAFHQKRVWKCLQAHTSQVDWQPADVPALWAGQRSTTGTTPDDFVQPTGSHDAYNTGDRVMFEGSVYESTIDANVWTPTAHPQGWQLIE